MGFTQKTDKLDMIYEGMIYEGRLKKDLMKISSMGDSDEKDEIASSLMDYIDSKRASLNKAKGIDPKVYNKNIQISKEVNNMISDLVDGKGDMKKILYRAKELGIS